MRDINALIVDGGGRGFELFSCLKKSERVKKLLIAPGNGGIQHHHRRLVKDTDLKGLVQLAQDEGINLVVVGPEAPLIAGLADSLTTHNIRVFGPSAAAAELEGSKIFTSTRCRRWNIPTADFDFAGDFDVAVKIIRRTRFRVIKADGLCAGKGVVVADSEEEAIEAARACLVEKIHGEAGEKIVIAERLHGRECSMMFLCDGVNALALPPARDFKRVHDGDTGPNTGGTGAFSPVPGITRHDVQFVLDRMILPTLRGMAERGTPFQGLLYAGLMITEQGPKLIEYNVRFGDPETQVVLPRIVSDIVPYLIAATENGGLAKMPFLTVKDDAVVGVVAMAEGYPGTPLKGDRITGLEQVPDAIHAGTKRDEEGFVTNGGRVFMVRGEGQTIAAARADAYAKMQRISFDGMHYRTDIAANI